MMRPMKLFTVTEAAQQLGMTSGGLLTNILSGEPARAADGAAVADHSGGPGEVQAGASCEVGTRQEARGESRSSPEEAQARRGERSMTQDNVLEQNFQEQIEKIISLSIEVNPDVVLASKWTVAYFSRYSRSERPVECRWSGPLGDMPRALREELRGWMEAWWDQCNKEPTTA
jgi:hypothetical protein